MPHATSSNTATVSPVSEHAPRSLRAILLCSITLVLVDFFLGPVIQFPVLFFLPVMWAAWRCGTRVAVTLALAFALMRFACHWYWGFPFDVTPAVINSVLRAAGLMAVAVVTANIAALTRNLKRRVALLEARLEVCGECGVVREADGSWMPLDHGHPPPRRHTRCPSCEEKHYGPL